jgi:hypothetical protein
MYGRGDYYQGDYYRGDPGIFSGIGKFIKGVAKVGVGLLPGPVGAIARAVTGVKRATVQVGPGAGTLALPEVSFGERPSFPLGPQFNGEMQVPAGTMLRNEFIPGCQLKGTRPNKSGYYKQITKGDPSRVVYVPPKSVCVKTRRINIANPRALRRAVRRAQGFAKMARRVMTFVSAKAPRGRAKFRKR